MQETCPSDHFQWKVNEWCINQSAQLVSYAIAGALFVNACYVAFLLGSSVSKGKKITTLKGLSAELTDNGTYCVLSYFLLINSQTLLIIVLISTALSLAQFLSGSQYLNLFIAPTTATCDSFRQSTPQMGVNMLIILMNLLLNTLVML